MKAVDERLTALGVKNLFNVSKCLKAGILNGFVKLMKPEDDTGNNFGLDQVQCSCFVSILRGLCQVLNFSESEYQDNHFADVLSCLEQADLSPL